MQHMLLTFAVCNLLPRDRGVKIVDEQKNKTDFKNPGEAKTTQHT